MIPRVTCVWTICSDYVADCSGSDSTNAVLCPPNPFPEYCAATSAAAQPLLENARQECLEAGGEGTIFDAGVVYQNAGDAQGSYCVSGSCDDCAVVGEKISDIAKLHCCDLGKEPISNIPFQCFVPAQSGPGVTYSVLNVSHDPNDFCEGDILSGDGFNLCGVPASSSSGDDGESSSSLANSYCDDNPDDPACESYFRCRENPDLPECFHPSSASGDYCDDFPDSPLCEGYSSGSVGSSGSGGGECDGDECEGGGGGGGSSGSGGGPGGGGYCEGDDCGDGPGDASCFRTAREANYVYASYRDACSKCKGKPAYFVNSSAWPGWHCVFGECFGCLDDSSPGGSSCHRSLSEAGAVLSRFADACGGCGGSSGYFVNSSSYEGWHCVVGECFGCQGGAGDCSEDGLNVVERFLCYLWGDNFDGDVDGDGEGECEGGGCEFYPSSVDTVIPGLSGLYADTGSWRGFVDEGVSGVGGVLGGVYAPVLRAAPDGSCACPDIFPASSGGGIVLVDFIGRVREFFCDSASWLGFDFMSALSGFVRILSYVFCLAWAMRFFD